MPKTRDNHYVPQWYQKGFISNESDKLHYLNLSPDKIYLPNGTFKHHNSINEFHTTQCFYQTDLYTTFFGLHINDEIETKLFGEIDNTGSKAVWAFISEDTSRWHKHFTNFFTYIDSQKIRTPKGLDWIRNHYPDLGQNELMQEMQGIRNMHCTIWSEGVREIVSAKDSKVKFILSDHPVTIYNYACPPDHKKCKYPNDPDITLKGSQTIFPLDQDHCLILTNYEYAKEPKNEPPLKKRTFARHNRESMVRTDAFIRTRFLNDNDVKKINLIIKTRANRYIAAAQKEWLYPERDIALNWPAFKDCLLPPEEELWKFGGEMFAGFEDGSTYYQDAFGRTTPENKYLIKTKNDTPIKPNEACRCGSGKKFKKCCSGKSEAERPSWEVLSIRERNIAFFNGISNVLGFDKGKTWDDIRKELSDEQVKRIYELYAVLWPIETDILSLLPKPDKNSRALYTGIIDPRVISEFAISITPYFDEIIIQNPIVNPNCLSSEINPIKHPNSYKQQALKDIMLFILLMPFVEKGYINLIPDPCAFDTHLRNQMFKMAADRSQNQFIHEKDIELMKELQKDDFERFINMMPHSYQRKQIREACPELNNLEVEETIKFIEKKKLSDPLALLQKDIYKKEGGQFLMSNLSPNFEIALFLSQVTGSILLTDNHYRWNEILCAQYRDEGIVKYDWNELSSFINSFEYSLNRNSEFSFHLRISGKLGEIRKTMKEVFLAIQSNVDPNKINSLVETLKTQYQSAYNAGERNFDQKDDGAFKGKFHCLIPQGGIVHNNAQRMILTSGIDNYMPNVPMAVLVEHA